ncbi:MAG: hypothetical protein ACLFWB_00805 [Armatimonadota bacterium]
MSEDTWEEARSVGRRLWDGLKRATTSASEAADRTLTIARLRSSVKRLHKQRRKVERIIGEKVYALHKKGKVRNADILQECERIDEMRSRIEELEQRIEQMQAEEPEDTPDLVDDSPLTGQDDEQQPGTPVEVETDDFEEQTEEPDLTDDISLEDDSDEVVGDIDITISTPHPEDDDSTGENVEEDSGSGDEDI